MTKNSENKTNCPKNSIKIPSDWIADATGASVSLVRKVRKGDRSGEKGAGSKVQVAEILFLEGANKLIAEVKRIVKF